MRVLVPTAGRRNILLDAIRQCPQVTRLVTTEIDYTAPGVIAADVCYRVPPSGAPTYLDAVESICRREGITHILPLADLDLERFAAQRERFGALGASVVCAPQDTVNLCMDKWRTHSFLRELDIPLPWTAPLPDAAADPERVPFPVCLKPGHAGMKNSPDYFFQRLETPAELATWRERLGDRAPRYLVQEHLEARRELNVDFFAIRGSVRRVVVLHRHGWGAGGGITRGTTVPCPPEVASMTQRLVAALNYDGPGNFQVWTDDSGGYAVTEINPRFSNSSALVGIPAGENFFRHLFDVLAGGDVPPRTNGYAMLTVTCAYAPRVVSDEALVDPFA